MEERLDVVWHDGVRMKDETLVGMAKKAGSYALAEHYLVTLMAHGLMYGFYGGPIIAWRRFLCLSRRRKRRS